MSTSESNNNKKLFTNQNRETVTPNMDFNLSEPVRARDTNNDAFANAFPLTTRLETRFRDDSEKLHSDLVGVSLDPRATPFEAEAEDGDAEEAEKGAGHYSIEEDEGLFSLPVTWSNIKTRKAVSKVRQRAKTSLSRDDKRKVAGKRW